MSSPRLPHESGAAVARRAREEFLTHVETFLVPLVQAIRSRLAELVGTSLGSREMHERNDALLNFEDKGPVWARGTARAWRKAVVAPARAARDPLEDAGLELIGNEVVERKILSSRLALAIQEKASWELNDLKVRMQHLEGGEGLDSWDVLRPETFAQLLVEQWEESGLKREAWGMVQDIIQREILAHVVTAYHATNEYLIRQGVMPKIDLSARVKRRGKVPPPARRPDGSAEAPLDSGDGQRDGAGHAGGYARSDGGASFDSGNQGGYGGEESGGWDGGGSRSGGYRPGPGTGHGPGTGGGGYGGAQGGHSGEHQGRGGPGEREPGGEGHQGAQPATGGPPGGSRGAQRAAAIADETRLMTSSPPLARARMRATGVLGQLKRMLSDRIVGFESGKPRTASPVLAEALSQQQQFQQDTEAHGSTLQGTVVYDDAAVQKVAVDLRRRTGELKKKAATPTEKATIEIVALMFQSILSEERIPPAIRVWFARLQMPVLRVAIAEPEFFGSLEHPARQLIDRMGSCVMGFDAAAIGGSALETEIKRIVQVIEQYPETGRRVFQLVFDEFLKFLSKFLTERAPTQRLVSVAQQVEQKETLAIQYTIEMRSMLGDMPVREEIREFLFKVWAEVLALAAIKNGPQHDNTLVLKNCASELVWAASAKPNRKERAQVIQDLPRLLQRLREGMTLVGIEGKEQEAHIKVIGDTLADAFLSKTEAIAPSRIEEMAKRLAHLEDFVSGDTITDLPLDAESIEMMLGMDASSIEVVADGGSRPSDAMLAWAVELQLGNWFVLDHNGSITQVQYAWHSDRKQLHLFAAPGGRSYLVQVRRLASYLQAGLLLPAEEEALTVRATRDALAKIDANPERLLQ